MAKQPTYRDTLRYIYRFTDYEKKGLAAYSPEFYSLDRMRRLLTLLGDPQQSFRAVHVAGTKGKGSTAAMIESVLRAAGYRTGLYTSPHLHSFRERIRVDGQLIPESDMVRLIQGMRPLLKQIAGITTFEVMTGLAFAWFAQVGVEWAVLEVGLGGRLDATNVVTPAVAVITSISRDHTAILGETHAEIAAEKAGIVKHGVPVVSSPQSDEALAVIEATCQQHGAPLAVVGRDWTWEMEHNSLEGQSFLVRHGGETVGEFRIPLLGEYQLANATTALVALSLLEQMGVQVPQAAVAEGLQSVRWPGRLEILGRSPFVVADSAHNGASARNLMEALRTLFHYRRLITVLGASSDHVTPELLNALLTGTHRAIATKTRHPRAATPEWIQEQAAELGFEMEVSPAVPEALALALADATAEDLICCTGSVFVAAEARKAWFARQGMSLPPSDPI
jgi:dihydrofolate synthase/folylpolyglutamate synthase